jgi:hypothetical protein
MPALPRCVVRGAAVLALTSALAAPAALAAQFSGTLEFITPTGVVGPTDDIPVWIRFTLDPDSPDALNLTGDGGGSPPFGVPPEYLPTEVSADIGEGVQLYQGTFVNVWNVFLNTAFLCSGTFTTSCTTGPPYDFEFNTSGPDTINFVSQLSLQPGEVKDYLFGTFKPTAPVAEGTYYFFGSYLSLNVFGDFESTSLVLDEFGDPVPVLDEFGDPVFDDEGNPVYEVETVFIPNADASYDIARTPCAFGPDDPSCAGAFSRTVVGVVPVPPALWLFGSAVGLLGWRFRR